MAEYFITQEVQYDIIEDFYVLKAQTEKVTKIRLLGKQFLTHYRLIIGGKKDTMAK